ncbi:AAA domain-containing protein, partial [archaeon]|nr:AAA domain-containing protein [archaeon]
GKTTLSKYLGQVFLNKSEYQIEKAILRGHQQLTEEKMLGTLNFKQILSPDLIPEDGEIDVKWNEFVKSEWKIIDEINRLTPYAQNILLSLLAEGVVKYQNQSYPIGDFTVFATMNPPDEGNEILPPPFMDRFALALPITMPDHSTLQTIGKTDDSQKNDFSFSLGGVALNEIKDEVSKLKYDPEAEEFINNIVSEYRLCDRIVKEASDSITVDNGLCTNGSECRYLTTELPCSKIEHPLSVRVKQDLYKYGKALAWFLGYDTVKVIHINALAPYMIWHRSKLSERYIRNNLKEYFNNNKFSVNANLDGTKEIVSLIFNKFEHRMKNFLIDYKKAMNADLHIDELEQLIDKCSGYDEDLMIIKEIHPELVKLKKVYTKVIDYKKAIKEAYDPRVLMDLHGKLKREYSIQIRQQLSKEIETKIRKNKITKFDKQRFKIVISDIIDLKSVKIEIKGLKDFKKEPLSSLITEYDLTVMKIDNILYFEYQGPENTQLINELKKLTK